MKSLLLALFTMIAASPSAFAACAGSPACSAITAGELQCLRAGCQFIEIGYSCRSSYQSNSACIQMLRMEGRLPTALGQTRTDVDNICSCTAVRK